MTANNAVEATGYRRLTADVGTIDIEIAIAIGIETRRNANGFGT